MTHPIDETSWKFIERKEAQLRALEQQLQGAISLLIDQNKLEGTWRLDLENRQLVCVDKQLKAA